MFKMKFADIGEGLTEGKVIEVFVSVGDSVKEGAPLFSVETDKVNSDIYAPITGKVAQVLIKPDQEIKVGEIVLEFDDGTAEENINQPATPTPLKEENASVVGSTPVSDDLIPSRAPLKSTPKTTPDPTTLGTDKNSVDPLVLPNNHYDYDVAIVGGGIGGYVSAIKLAQFGLKTLIVEEEHYGGVCLNVGCIPTKSLLKSAQLYNQIKNNASNLGIEVGSVSANWSKMQKRKNSVIDRLTSGVQYLLKKNKVAILKGTATAINNHTIKVNDQEISFADLIIATGSSPNKLELPGFAEARADGFLINSTSALVLPEIPKKLIIIGGGVIGVEFACVYSNLGTRVTILQGLPTILEMFDKDISEEMTKILTEEYKITIIPNAKVLKIKNRRVYYEVNNEEKTLLADYCLESIGRKANAEAFAKLNLQKTPRGFIEMVNDQCQTNIPNIYSVGDVNGKLMLAHVAYRQAMVTASHIAFKRKIPNVEELRMNFDEVASCVYTHPEIAVVGKTEEQCKELGINYKTFKFPFSAIGKAIADGDDRGFVKLIADVEYGKILGGHLIGNRVTEIIGEIVLAISTEATIESLANAIHSHPTMSEAVGESAEAIIFGQPIHF